MPEFRRPPKEHQFQKGKSGNPNGRPPKRSKSTRELCLNALATRVARSERKGTVSLQDLLMLELAREAVLSPIAGERIFAYAEPLSHGELQKARKVLPKLAVFKRLENDAGFAMGSDDEYEKFSWKKWSNLSINQKFDAYNAIVKSGHIGAEIARDLEHIKLPGEDD